MSLPNKDILKAALLAAYQNAAGTELTEDQWADIMASCIHGYETSHFNGHTHQTVAIGSPTSAPNP